MGVVSRRPQAEWWRESSSALPAPDRLMRVAVRTRREFAGQHRLRRALDAAPLPLLARVRACLDAVPSREAEGSVHKSRGEGARKPRTRTQKPKRPSAEAELSSAEAEETGRGIRADRARNPSRPSAESEQSTTEAGLSLGESERNSSESAPFSSRIRGAPGASAASAAYRRGL